MTQVMSSAMKFLPVRARVRIVDCVTFHFLYPVGRALTILAGNRRPTITLDIAMKKHDALARRSLVAFAAASFTIAGTRSPAGRAMSGFQPGKKTQSTLLDTLVRLERSALDRWIRLDPDGYLVLYADDATYFDPTADK